MLDSVKVFRKWIRTFPHVDWGLKIKIASWRVRVFNKKGKHKLYPNVCENRRTASASCFNDEIVPINCADILYATIEIISNYWQANYLCFVGIQLAISGMPKPKSINKKSGRNQRTEMYKNAFKKTKIMHMVSAV